MLTATRANIANAKIQGMEADLQLHGNQYNIAYMMFTVGYVAFGIPANLIFKKTGPKSLSVMMFLWAITVIGQGLTRNTGGLIACRFLEGILEAGFVPGCAYLIGSYYKSNEFLKRYTVFFCASVLAGAFNGLLATLISKMDGIGGYAGWRWIFIIEGLITIVLSFCSIFWIVPFPEKSTMFSPEDKAVLLARIAEDGGQVSHDHFDLKSFAKNVLDWKIWICVLSYIGAEENAASVLAFQPSILKGLGYTATEAQIHTIPIWAVSFCSSFIFAWLSEHLQQRYLFGMFGSLVSLTGLAIELAYPSDPNVRYMGMFFLSAGSYLIMPLTVVWCAINVGKGYKRTVALACVIAVGNCGAFVAGNVFITEEAPTYRTGFSTNMGFICLTLVSQTVFYLGLRRENKKRDERRAALPEVLDEKIYENSGDQHPDFRYQL
ncbi:permease of the major facilitator superfamily [Thozetella sp. PMI_491]|nr:permease of the major facilitator superfamily [Thozetella sp. PMI_491]